MARWICSNKLPVQTLTRYNNPLHSSEACLSRRTSAQIKNVFPDINQRCFQDQIAGALDLLSSVAVCHDHPSWRNMDHGSLCLFCETCLFRHLLHICVQTCVSWPWPYRPRSYGSTRSPPHRPRIPGSTTTPSATMFCPGCSWIMARCIRSVCLDCPDRIPKSQPWPKY